MKGWTLALSYLSRFIIIVSFHHFPPTEAGIAFSLRCLAKHGEFLSHPYDCTKFVRCSHRQAYIFQCPSNLYWNPIIRTCDYPQWSKCALNALSENVNDALIDQTNLATTTELTKVVERVEADYMNDAMSTEKSVVSTKQQFSIDDSAFVGLISHQLDLQHSKHKKIATTTTTTAKVNKSCNSNYHPVNIPTVENTYNVKVTPSELLVTESSSTGLTNQQTDVMLSEEFPGQEIDVAFTESAIISTDHKLRLSINSVDDIRLSAISNNPSTTDSFINKSTIIPYDVTDSTNLIEGNLSGQQTTSPFFQTDRLTDIVTELSIDNINVNNTISNVMLTTDAVRSTALITATPKYIETTSAKSDNLFTFNSDSMETLHDSSKITMGKSLQESNNRTAEHLTEFRTTSIPDNSEVQTMLAMLRTSTDQDIETATQSSSISVDVVAAYFTANSILLNNAETNQQGSTLIGQMFTEQQEKSANLFDRAGESFTTASVLLSGTRTAFDPRLPFRSHNCRGNNNRRQFQATKCSQYFQCFAGWAFLLNCQEGQAFQPQAASCMDDTTMECNV